MKIILKKFKLKGATYYRCENDEQDYLLSHLLNGQLFNNDVGACVCENEIETLKKLAEAHGWNIEIKGKK